MLNERSKSKFTNITWAKDGIFTLQRIIAKKKNYMGKLNPTYIAQDKHLYINPFCIKE
jgi:uncharacterized protein YbgA (DUF1722 family)